MAEAVDFSRLKEGEAAVTKSPLAFYTGADERATVQQYAPFLPHFRYAALGHHAGRHHPYKVFQAR